MLNIEHLLEQAIKLKFTKVNNLSVSEHDGKMSISFDNNGACTENEMIDFVNSLKKENKLPTYLQQDMKLGIKEYGVIIK